jgi:hypothetical protein
MPRPPNRKRCVVTVLDQTFDSPFVRVPTVIAFTATFDPRLAYNLNNLISLCGYCHNLLSSAESARRCSCDPHGSQAARDTLKSNVKIR